MLADKRALSVDKNKNGHHDAKRPKTGHSSVSKAQKKTVGKSGYCSDSDKVRPTQVKKHNVRVLRLNSLCRPSQLQRTQLGAAENSIDIVTAGDNQQEGRRNIRCHIITNQRYYSHLSLLQARAKPTTAMKVTNPDYLQFPLVHEAQALHPITRV